MGVLSNYGEVKDAVASYAKRSNTTFTGSLPIFVMSAHSALMRDLDPDLQLLTATADLTINAERVAPPSGFRSVVRLAIDDAYDDPLVPTSIENRLRTATANSSGRPLEFCMEANQLAFGPIPDTTYTGKLVFRKAFTFFASDLATNDLLDRYPMAYLYGALAEAYDFDKFDEEAAKYTVKFQAEIEKINQAERRFAQGGGVLRPHPSSTAV